MKQVVPAPSSVKVRGGCGWGWHPVLGHWSRWWGGWVPPHCASYYGWWAPYGGSDNAYGWSGRYGPEDDWGGARFGIPTEAGEVPPVVGVIHNQSPPGLSRCYLGQGLFFDVGSRNQEKIPEIRRWIVLAASGVLCMRLRVSAICFARRVLRL